MVKKNIKVVIGANFGDEGKGLMADYFCHQAIAKRENCIVVCHNGGAQRGHTVTTPDGLRHVFHHFGSGTFTGADTYFSKDFILNPIMFRKEWEELTSVGYQPVVFISKDCRIVTPFDMIINQIAEESRSDKRHGSCGMGIFETIKRYESYASASADSLLNNLSGANTAALKLIREEYLPRRLKELGVSANADWMAIINNDGLISHYLDDLKFMNRHVFLTDDSVLHEYQSIVFEGGQGLLLDQNNTEYFPHLTPSNTGLKNPAEMISRLFPASDVEVCYITRPYLTRHGAGRLDNECRKEEINPYMEDLTNVPNPHQGTLRYGKMDAEKLKQRIRNDFADNNSWKLSLAITHQNEIDAFSEWNYNEFIQEFDSIYYSNGQDRTSIRLFQGIQPVFDV